MAVTGIEKLELEINPVHFYGSNYYSSPDFTFVVFLDVKSTGWEIDRCHPGAEEKWSLKTNKSNVVQVPLIVPAVDECI